MTKITNKQKEAISEIYLMTVVSTDIHCKLSFLSHLYAAIRSALLCANMIELNRYPIKIKDNKGNEKEIYKFKLESTNNDQFDSARLLIESKSKLFEAYSAYAYRDNWIQAEQIIIDIVERLSALGYQHDFFDVDPERWSASYSMIAPTGSLGDEDAD